MIDDLGSLAETAAAAIRAARQIHEASERGFGEVREGSRLMRVGLHWGSNLSMGQLHPGERLDVTALGDEVNECARIQEAAGTHETLASKQLIEQLTDDVAAQLGLELEKISYDPLSELASAREKVAADAGNISVTHV